ncbi:MAG: OsmC family protein [Candidatus Bipolaricaulota bacterium]
MITVNYGGGMKFVGRGASGHDVVMDASEANGGGDSAARPVEVLLCALGGCTGMDVVSILRKMKTEPKSLRIEISDERAPEYPKVLRRIHLSYVLGGDVPRVNVDKAIDLSLSKYCPIANTLAGVSEITHDVRFEKG